MQVNIKIDDKEFRKSLRRLEALMGDLTPVMHDIGEELLSNWKLHWKEEEDPYGHKWEKLSPVTLARRKGDRAQILRDTGRLLGSYNVKALHDSVMIGTNVVYATTHQFGAKKGQFGFGKKRKIPIPFGDIPARKMLPDIGLTQEDYEDISSTIKKALDKCLRR